MKSKKYVIGYAIAVFVLVFIIAFNSVCSITQFDVRFETGSASAAQSAEKVQERLNGYLNKSYLFFKTANVGDIVAEICEEDGTYLKVVSVQKKFPNKVTAVIEEEYEQYAFYSEADNKYYVTDADGKVLAVKESADNNISENAANVEITGFTYSSAAEGETLGADESVQFSLLMDLLWVADEKLGGAFGRFSKIEYLVNKYDDEFFCFTFTEGVKIWLTNIMAEDSREDECFSAALDAYAGLSDAEKTYGYLLAVVSTSGVHADYNTGVYDPVANG